MAEQKRDGDSYTGAPRWVKVFGVAALILVLTFVVLHLTGRGFRGHFGPATSGERGVHQP
jgi:hypothetical protein